MKTKEEAQIICNTILKILGKGWKGCVRENLGWYVSWINGAVSLHYSENTTKPFSSMIGDLESGTGLLYLTNKHAKHFANPIDAIKNSCNIALEIANKEISPIIDSVKTIQNKYK